jgi:nitrite reductase (NADH) small subunit
MADLGVQLHDVGPATRIPVGEGRKYLVAGEGIAIFRSRRNELYAVQAECPHAGGPLADGLLGAGRVVCPLHGHTFDLSTGDAARKDCPALRTYTVTANEQGHILVAVTSREED